MIGNSSMEGNSSVAAVPEAAAVALEEGGLRALATASWMSEIGTSLYLTGMGNASTCAAHSANPSSVCAGLEPDGVPPMITSFCAELEKALRKLSAAALLEPYENSADAPPPIPE